MKKDLYNEVYNVCLYNQEFNYIERVYNGLNYHPKDLNKFNDYILDNYLGFRKQEKLPVLRAKTKAVYTGIALLIKQCEENNR